MIVLSETSFVITAPAAINDNFPTMMSGIIVAPMPMKDMLPIFTLPAVHALGATWTASPISLSCSITAAVFIRETFEIIELFWNKWLNDG